MSEFEGRRRSRRVGHRELLAACLVALAGAAAAIAPGARAAVWQPSPGHVQAPIWPGTPPDAVPDPKPESCCSLDVARPTMTVYAPKGHNTGVAVVVFPGGGYQVLAMDLEGTEICDWLTSRGITCVLLKYRVPDSGPTMKNGHRYYPPVQTALQDAQRTLGLVRQHAAQWHVDPHKVGVIGFSAGGHLVAAGQHALLAADLSPGRCRRRAKQPPGLRHRRLSRPSVGARGRGPRHPQPGGPEPSSGHPRPRRYAADFPACKS